MTTKQPVFELSKAKATLSSYTPRRELHGEDPKPAATLRFNVTLSADELAMFSPTLRHSLYCKSNSAAQGDAVNAIAEANDLRYPEIEKPLAWKKEIIGAELAIEYGLDESSNIVLPMSDVDDFQIEAMPGGMVIVSFRVACHPDERQSGRLAFMIARECEISLEPPQPAADLAGEVPRGRRSRKESRDEAEKAFH